MKDFIMQNFLGRKDMQKIACAVKNTPPVLFLVHKVTELLVSLPALRVKGKRAGTRRRASCTPSSMEPWELACCCLEG